MKLRFRRARSPVLRLPWRLDADRLQTLFADTGVQARLLERNTLALTHRPGSSDPWSDGLTARALSDGEALFFSEAHFTNVNPGLEGTYFESVLKTLDEATLGRRGRVRLFRRPPQTSSSLHRDLDVRVHAALSTSDRAFLVFPELGVFRIPRDGHLYLVDTTRPHFAVNTHSQECRTHLIAATYCGFRESRELEREILDSSRKLFEEMARFRGCEAVMSARD